jgi:hypothetical protein
VSFSAAQSFHFIAVGQQLEGVLVGAAAEQVSSAGTVKASNRAIVLGGVQNESDIQTYLREDAFI